MSVSATSNITSGTADLFTNSRLPSQTLDQKDFLKLLVTQMTSQDPLNPKADLDSISQMAQFSNLEQTQAMQREIALLRGHQELIQANGMLGREVVLETSDGVTASGAVEAVEIVEGTPRIIVNGVGYGLGELRYVALTKPTE